tara:strand:+ start:80 stop:211 length:132 start_codon:yes stop_codon:yes gene_type:complete
MDEKITEAISKIDYILDYKFITAPVREDLLAIKITLQSILGAS